MIRSKEELRQYLETDKIALDRKGKRPSFTDVIWKFQINLRYYEYYLNCRSGVWGG